MIRKPGGDLTWMTPLFIIFGTYLAVWNILHGVQYLAAIYGMLAVCSVLVWFDVWAVALPMMLYFSVAVFGLVLQMLAQGLNLSRVARLFFLLYTIYGFWEWRKRRKEEADALREFIE